MSHSGRHLVLVGLMGTGKSTAGGIVARRLRRPYVDNDDQLGAIDGRTAKAIAEADGEARLHELELDVLRDALAGDEPAVIGAAASVVDTEPGRALLAQPLVVWLKANPRKLAARISASKKQHRPLGDDAAATLRRQAASRDPWFASLADIVVDADRAHEPMAEQIILALTGADL